MEQHNNKFECLQTYRVTVLERQRLGVLDLDGVVLDHVRDEVERVLVLLLAILLNASVADL
jgi:hypothetical protein